MHDRKELVLKVVRGEKPLTDLKAAGISLGFRGVSEGSRSREIVVSPRGDSSLTVAPTAADLARGLRTYQGQPERLKDWGAFILGADVIDLEPLESEPHGDLILSGVWDASFEGQLDEEVAAAVAGLTQ